MANTLTNVIDKLLAQGLSSLREMAIMPQLVNRKYEKEAGEKGSSIDVPVPSAITAVAVSPSNTPPSTADISPGNVSISLDQWFEAPFYLTDKEMLEVQRGTIPMQAQEAVKAIVNKVDTSILGTYTDVYGYFGTAGTTPFGTPGIADATGVRKTLEKQLAPRDPRNMVLDPDAEASALGLTQFGDSSFSGSVQAILEGKLNRKLGFQWWMDQNIPTHTAGAGTGYLLNGGEAAGATAITVDTGTGAFNVGDILTIAGVTGTYVVTAAYAGGAGDISISPGLAGVAADNAAVTETASHVVNLGFHRDAFALATRPLETATEGLGTISRTGADPISKLAMRLEVSREHKRTRFSYDMLWGVKCVRPELACRLAG